MAGINKVILVGNLGKDPEVKAFESGVKVAQFTLATTENYKDKNTGERKEVTEWHNIVCWRGLAEVAERYLAKGRQIYVEGKLRTRSWDDTNGVKHYVTEVVADNFIMLGSKPDGVNTAPAPVAVQSVPQPAPAIPANNDVPPFQAEEDDLPF
ncbi:MAG: single-stranded DNA-binding protein [Bacteroidales bacterium]|jgi:single-strand DNA-binding protein|nr:single-stranded DNA-binding protein [Bacteroidales bacterium]